MSNPVLERCQCIYELRWDNEQRSKKDAIKANRTRRNIRRPRRYLVLLKEAGSWQKRARWFCKDLWEHVKCVFIREKCQGACKRQFSKAPNSFCVSYSLLVGLILTKQLENMGYCFLDPLLKYITQCGQINRIKLLYQIMSNIILSVLSAVKSFRGLWCII